MRVGNLVRETGLTHSEIDRMDAERVQRLLTVHETVLDHRQAEAERKARSQD